MFISFRLAALLALVSIFISSCTSPPTADKQTLFSINNCGLVLTFNHYPQRTVTLDQESAETLLALGLRDKIAGTSYDTADASPLYKKDYYKLKMLNPKTLTAVQLREANPDFVVAELPAEFTRDAVGTREELLNLDVPAYISSAACPQFSPGINAFQRLFNDYSNYGTIFHVPDKAKALIAWQKKLIENFRVISEHRKNYPHVLYLYSVANGLPYVAGNAGIVGAINSVLHVQGTFSDVAQDWFEVSWEQIAERNPDVIVLADLRHRGIYGDLASQKINILRKDPVLSQLQAVRKGRFIIVPGIELNNSVRGIHALQLISEGLQRIYSEH